MGNGAWPQPMRALQSIAIINGKASTMEMNYLAWLNLIRPSEDVKKGKGSVATCTIKRDVAGEEVTERTFSKDDAVKSKLWGKAGPWQQYPDRMLQMRARGLPVMHFRMPSRG